MCVESDHKFYAMQSIRQTGILQLPITDEVDSGVVGCPKCGGVIDFERVKLRGDYTARCRTANCLKVGL